MIDDNSNANNKPIPAIENVLHHQEKVSKNIL